mgnify:CR=1 FL=1
MDIIVFLLVLSLLIFVHELGHFLAAKACNVYVDRFSIGMPPRVFGVRLGETDYCVGLLPIGGFVKMAGQEDAPLSEEEREEQYGHVPPERWFNRKPVWQRYIVTIAGPFMNLVLAVVLYGALAAAGSNVPESEIIPRIGEVVPDSPAAEAPLYVHEPEKSPEDYTGEPDARGWETGDLIVSLDGRAIDNIGELAVTAILDGPGTPHNLVLERTTLDGETTRYFSRAAPQVLEGEEHPRFGVGTFETAVIGDVFPGKPGAAAGLDEGDAILGAGGEIVDRDTFISKVEDLPKSESMVLTLETAEGKRREVTLTPATIGRFTGMTWGPYVGPGEDTEAVQEPPRVLATTETFENETGIQRKDVIVEINGEPATAAKLAEMERNRPGEVLEVTVQRPAIAFGLLQEAKELTLELPVSPVRAIGVSLQVREVFHRTPPAQVIPEAFRQSYMALEKTVLTVKALISRTVSPKHIGGPVMIFDITTKAAEIGFSWLVRIVAFISINLAVFNLLPLPVLDGGLLVIHGVEAIRGKPLSQKFQERFQQAGLLLIIALMLFVTWNDIGRIINDLTP